MNQFSIYFQLGLEHISDFQGIDHIVFLMTLCAVYSASEWKKVTILVTAFTIGHSLSLALSALHIVSANSQLVEFLIPLTILCTAVTNIFYATKSIRNNTFRYLIVLLFGVIHGLGFSNFFSALMGSNQSITFPLLAFNIGLEVGQMLIVCAFFSLYFLLNRFESFTHNKWKYLFSFTGAVIALFLIYSRISLL
ncbi:MAG: HupE/UreJ family protein [Sporocytophaga sp.]|uniref:HupE/UreJ family protein n=1 Tax=Sporocytophaga sp. TaxID=2231183 RepID=UPI001B1BF605|nr:HupE/UreJ family protein [Sporocytophaga sp.]MBO9700100.1 HupE/UreJ family protein [Sporocytophaga sp.]